MNLAIFDLDDTLLDGDSDYLWGVFLSLELNRDPDAWKDGFKEFDHHYRAGQVDIDAYQRYTLQSLTWQSTQWLDQARVRFQKDWIQPRITPQARARVAWHRNQGHQIIIATATNRFVAQAGAREIEADHLVATEPLMENNQFTGQHELPSCFAEHKITHLTKLLGDGFLSNGITWFYSDSNNDLPLLKSVTHPHVINPDDKLASIAEENRWPIDYWRRNP